tara:strand:+ start:180 stop:338 length:159 start_codon:yes stop_codon:yes gene_type:complete
MQFHDFTQGGGIGSYKDMITASSEDQAKNIFFKKFPSAWELIVIEIKLEVLR